MASTRILICLIFLPFASTLQENTASQIYSKIETILNTRKQQSASEQVYSKAYIQNPNTKLVLGIPADSVISEGMRIVMTEMNSLNSLIFIIKEDGSVRIASDPRYALDMSRSSHADESSVLLKLFSGSPSQRWNVTPHGVVIALHSGGLVLTIFQSNPNVGVHLIGYHDHHGWNQRWNFVPVSN